MPDETDFHYDPTGKEYNFDQLQLGPGDFKIVSDEDGYTIEVKSTLIGRLLAYKLGQKIAPILRSSLLAALSNLDEPIDDRRLDGNQTSCSERSEAEPGKPTKHFIEVFVKYPDADAEAKLEAAIKELVEETEQLPT